MEIDLTESSSSAAPQPHRWAEVIKAWADGKTVQHNSLYDENRWIDYDITKEFHKFGPWHCAEQYKWRIKPEPKAEWIAISEHNVTSNVKETASEAIEHLKRIIPQHIVISAVIPITYTEGEGL